MTLAFDGDTAGRKATIASRDLCRRRAVGSSCIPSTGKDPDAFVRELGVEPFQRLLDGASGLVEWLINDALDVATFHRAPLQEQLDRVRSVGDLLAKKRSGDATACRSLREPSSRASGFDREHVCHGRPVATHHRGQTSWDNDDETRTRQQLPRAGLSGEFNERCLAR